MHLAVIRKRNHLLLQLRILCQWFIRQTLLKNNSQFVWTAPFSWTDLRHASLHYPVRNAAVICYILQCILSMYYITSGYKINWNDDFVGCLNRNDKVLRIVIFVLFKFLASGFISACLSKVNVILFDLIHWYTFWQEFFLHGMHHRVQKGIYMPVRNKKWN